MSKLAIVGAGCFTLLCSATYAADAVPAVVKAAIDDPARPVWQRARDAVLKPSETVAFSGIKPDDVVVDFVPGDGFYTRILSRLVGPKGKVYPLVPLPAGVRDGEMVRQHEAEAQAAGKPLPPNPVDAVLAIQNVARYANVTVLWQMLWQYDAQFSTPQQLDAVWSANAYHDLQNGTYGKFDMTAENKMVFLALKPGGTYTVVDYAAAKGAGVAAAKTLHRSDAEAVKAEILAAGFTLDGESKALANPSDDHGKLASVDKADAYVLRFRKPMNASGETKRPKTDPMVNWYENTQIGNVDAKGNVSGNRPRWSIYHKDGGYEEMGTTNPLQIGTWYWDAAGHNCMIHQFPATQRQFIVCHDYVEDHKVGEAWIFGKNADGSPKKSIILKGYVYPPLPAPEEIGKGY